MMKTEAKSLLFEKEKEKFALVTAICSVELGLYDGETKTKGLGSNPTQP